MRKNTHTPWSDVAELVSFDFVQDSQGFEELAPGPGGQPGTPTKRQVFCNFEEGVSQNEFYLSHKEGLRASASIELWTADYNGEQFVDFGERRYKVLRGFVSAFDVTTLILTEVIR